MLKAIETVHNGYRFRSRLEARWAVFYDAIGVRYHYELEGYDLGKYWYLPDFYLPDLDCFIEIKPDYPSDEEEEKAHLLAMQSGKSVYVFYDAIPYPHPGYGYWYDWESALWLSPNNGWQDLYQWWCQCMYCGKTGIEFEGRAARLKCGCYDISDDKERNFDNSLLVTAYAKARQARW